jgi:hypothetical protein
MIVNNIKKEIANNWLDNFIGLSIYSQNKLYKICGPFVLGIEILSLPRSEDYRPIFVCYPLWKPDVKQCLDEPIFMQEIYDNKGLQFNIPYVNNFVFLKEAVDCTKKQAPLLLEKNVFLNQIFESIDKQFSQGLIRASPIGQVKLLEAKLHAALYVDDANKCNNVFKELRHMVNNYDPTFLEWKFGNLEIWLSSLEKVITNRATFLKQIEVNKQDKKIAQLKNSELTA